MFSYETENLLLIALLCGRVSTSLAAGASKPNFFFPSQSLCLSSLCHRVSARILCSSSSLRLPLLADSRMSGLPVDFGTYEIHRIPHLHNLQLDNALEIVTKYCTDSKEMTPFLEVNKANVFKDWIIPNKLLGNVQCSTYK